MAGLVATSARSAAADKTSVCNSVTAAATADTTASVDAASVAAASDTAAPDAPARGGTGAETTAAGAGFGDDAGPMSWSAGTAECEHAGSTGAWEGLLLAGAGAGPSGCILQLATKETVSHPTSSLEIPFTSVQSRCRHLDRCFDETGLCQPQV